MYVLVYSSWDVYSQCSKTCGDGQRTRERTCIGGICSRATSQDLIETEVCNEGACVPPDLFVKASSSSGGYGTCVAGPEQAILRDDFGRLDRSNQTLAELSIPRIK